MTSEDNTGTSIESRRKAMYEAGWKATVEDVHGMYSPGDEIAAKIKWQVSEARLVELIKEFSSSDETANSLIIALKHGKKE